MIYHDLFPTVVATDRYSDKIDAINLLGSMSLTMGTSHYISSDHNVLDLDFLADLKEYIVERLNIYYREVLSEENVTPYITQSWFNVTEKNQETHPHRHPNSIVSGVFYIDADDEIIFYDVNGSSFNTKRSVKKMKVSKNDLILFPSTLLHYVPNHTKAKARMSIAFNSFATGTFGDHDILTGLTL
jgi:uncharacterized protein (TIGR02466 family)